ncbi:MAG: hypothetical protein Q7R39_16600 [Dehalococcoidia bacterium]|nr:hypothetical protein [Dehalococcoidia bacterium]
MKRVMLKSARAGVVLTIAMALILALGSPGAAPVLADPGGGGGGGGTKISAAGYLDVLSVAPTSVVQAAVVTVSATFSGLNGTPNTFHVVVDGPSGAKINGQSQFNTITPDSQQVTLTIPADANPGNWCVTEVDLQNFPGDRYHPSSLQFGSFSNGCFTVTPSDATAPVGNPTQSPVAIGGWNNTDVTVNWNWSDGQGSGIDVTNCTPSSTSVGEGAIVLTATCSDIAGNTGTASYNVNVDKSPPNAPTPIVSPTPTVAGWNNGDVTVSFNSNGDVGPSGVASCAKSSLLTDETGGTVVIGTCSDAAGNTSAPASVTVRIDKTVPNISSEATAGGAAYAGDTWTNKDVAVSFTSTGDVGLVQSGGVTCAGSTTLTGETAGTSVPGTCTDAAGNVASTSFGPVKIDKTAPVVLITGPSLVLQGSISTATVTASDALSGPAINPSGVLPLDAKSAGSHTVTVTAVDKAGNSASATLTYMVWGINGPFAPVIKLGQGTGQFKAGSTIPVKFQITDGASLIKTATGTVAIGTASAPFRWDDTAQQYVANVKTNAVDAGKTAAVQLNVTGAGTAPIANVSLR